MTRDDVIRMAREAGHPCPQADEQFLRDFAALVAAVEREACAKVCEVNHGTIKRNMDSFEIAAAIRARGAT